MCFMKQYLLFGFIEQGCNLGRDIQCKSCSYYDTQISPQFFNVEGSRREAQTYLQELRFQGSSSLSDPVVAYSSIIKGFIMNQLIWQPVFTGMTSNFLRQAMAIPTVTIGSISWIELSRLTLVSHFCWIAGVSVLVVSQVGLQLMQWRVLSSDIY